RLWVSPCGQPRNFAYTDCCTCCAVALYRRPDCSSPYSSSFRCVPVPSDGLLPLCNVSSVKARRSLLSALFYTSIYSVYYFFSPVLVAFAGFLAFFEETIPIMKAGTDATAATHPAMPISATPLSHIYADTTNSAEAASHT